MAELSVLRSGGNLSLRAAVNYKTRDGTAVAGKDYCKSEG